ncbi:unnamed protein product [Medioppia subpectinata]|uniref:C2H2-type domain-containing protein n=1 Tax=Medioppia subpectinata TaxID=1979941 RepID=A0A7R9PVI4_9ACAR|nr:unnamed protein product [Medioppia subpectinata]CAG2101833.1 unnamed protein product [Medioppia subpectinata]
MNFQSIGCQTSDEFINEELIQREDNTRHETQDNREKTSAEEVVDSEDNESNDSIDCHINDEINVGSDTEDNEDNNDMNENLNNKTNELNDNLSDNQRGSELNTTYDTRKRKYTFMINISEEYGRAMSDNSDDEWMAGIRTTRGSDGKYVCGLKDCGKSFTDHSLLVMHVFSHLNARMKKLMKFKRRPDGQYVCCQRGCDAIHEDIAALRVHQMSHLGGEDNEDNNNHTNEASVMKRSELNATTDITRKPNGKRKYTSMYSDVNDSEAQEYGRDFSDNSDEKQLCDKQLLKTSDGKYVCDYRGCGLQFSYSWGLRVHYYKHLNAKTKKSMVFEMQTDGRFECLMTDTCYPKYKNFVDLRAHQMSHLNLPFADYCDTDLSDNQMDDNSDDEWIVGKPVRKEPNGNYRCDYRGCGLQFSFSFGLRTKKSMLYSRYGWSGIGPFMCYMCRCHPSHTDVRQLRAHQMSHLRDPSEDYFGSSDEEMDDKSGDECMAGIRMRKASDGEYVCGHKDCGKSLTDHSLLPKHAFNHLDVRTQRELTHRKRSDGLYVCQSDACDVLYKDLADLRAHQLSHLSEPWICRQSEGADEWKEALSSALRNKTGLKLFGQTNDESINEELIQREDNTRHETQDNREKTSVEEVVDSEDNESNDGIDCHINDETDVGSDAEDNDDNNHINKDITRDETQSESNIDFKPIIGRNNTENNENNNHMNEDLNNKTNELNDNSSGNQCSHELNTTYNTRKRKYTSMHSEDNDSECEEYRPDLSDNEMDDNSGDEGMSGKPLPKGSDMKLVCEDCMKTFTDQSSLRKHSCNDLNAKTKNSMVFEQRLDGRYACLMAACNAIYDNTADLRSHQMSHLNEKFANNCDLDLSDNQMDNNFDGEGMSGKRLRRAPNGKYLCDYKSCGKSCTTRSNLRKHRSTHLSDQMKASMVYKRRSDGHFVCLINACNAVFNAKQALRTHQMSHLKDSLKCPQTDRPFAAHTRAAFQRHAKTHIMREKCPPIDCPNDANEEFNDESIDSQIKTKTNDKRKHKSAESEDNDSKTAEYGSGLSDNEMDNTFGVEWIVGNPLRKSLNGKYVCDYRGCGLQFITPSTLMGHQFKHLNAKAKKSLVFKKRSDGRFVCLIDECNAVFTGRRHFRGHQILHFKERLKCPQTDCPYTAVSRSALVQHRKTHPKPYACDTCGLKCRSNTLLRKHKRRHNDTLKFRCEWPECGRLFVNRSLLREHMNTHTAAVHHPCEWPGCGQSYTNKGSLSMHVSRVHKGLAEYRCHWPECDYQSTNRIRLNNHIHRQHEGLDDYQCSHTGCDYKTSKCAQSQYKKHTDFSLPLAIRFHPLVVRLPSRRTLHNDSFSPKTRVFIAMSNRRGRRQQPAPPPVLTRAGSQSMTSTMSDDDIRRLAARLALLAPLAQGSGTVNVTAPPVSHPSTASTVPANTVTTTRAGSRMTRYTFGPQQRSASLSRITSAQTPHQSQPTPAPAPQPPPAPAPQPPPAPVAQPRGRPSAALVPPPVPPFRSQRSAPHTVSQPFQQPSAPLAAAAPTQPSTQPTTRRSTHVLCDKYSGDTDEVNVDDWLRVYETVTIDYTDYERVIALPRHLSGRAIEWYAKNITEYATTISWDECANSMVERFDINRENSYRAAVSRRLQNGESVSDYFHEMTRHMSNADVSERNQLVMLTDGMSDYYRPHLSTAAPQSNREWFNIALALEKAKPQTSGSRQQAAYYDETDNESQQNSRRNTGRKFDNSKPPPGPCRHCGANHWNRDCPQRRTASHQNSSAQSTSTQAPIASNSSINTITTPGFIYYDTTVDGHPVRAFIDTGSHITAISKATADRIGLKPDPRTAQTLSHVNGQTRTEGSAKAKVRHRNIETIVSIVNRTHRYQLERHARTASTITESVKCIGAVTARASVVLTAPVVNRNRKPVRLSLQRRTRTQRLELLVPETRHAFMKRNTTYRRFISINTTLIASISRNISSIAILSRVLDNRLTKQTVTRLSDPKVPILSNRPAVPPILAHEEPEPNQNFESVNHANNRNERPKNDNSSPTSQSFASFDKQSHSVLNVSEDWIARNIVSEVNVDYRRLQARGIGHDHRVESTLRGQTGGNVSAVAVQKAHRLLSPTRHPFPPFSRSPAVETNTT